MLERNKDVLDIWGNLYSIATNLALLSKNAPWRIHKRCTLIPYKISHMTHGLHKLTIVFMNCRKIFQPNKNPSNTPKWGKEITLELELYFWIFWIFIMSFTSFVIWFFVQCPYWFTIFSVRLGTVVVYFVDQCFRLWFNFLGSFLFPQVIFGFIIVSVGFLPIIIHFISLKTTTVIKFFD